MTTRSVSRYYDSMLRPSGLKISQFSMLNDILRAQGISVGELAEAAAMDQTTVTRNVEVLRKNGWIDIKCGEDDSRRRSISVTEAGKERLSAAKPLWQIAQERLLSQIGEERYEQLLQTLAVLESIEARIEPATRSSSPL